MKKPNEMCEMFKHEKRQRADVEIAQRIVRILSLLQVNEYAIRHRPVESLTPIERQRVISYRRERGRGRTETHKYTLISRESLLQDLRACLQEIET